MAESPDSLDRTSSLERSGSFSEAMLHFKRTAVFKRKPEPAYSFCLHKHYCKAANRSNKIHCDCGETANEPLAWRWDRSRPAWSVTFRPSHVVCHETLSTGTAVLLGDTPLEAGGHHYFEVKLLTDLYGTDTMIGLCTDQFDPSLGEQRFISLLGCDRHSWGFSYHGKVQHAGETRSYGAVFGKGSIVGVYANLRAGQLEFFLNRRSLGVAFCELPRPSAAGGGPRLLPAFCTTAANTCVRLVTAASAPDSLQFQATAVITSRLPRWPLALPAALCRLVRRYAWLEYRQPPPAADSRVSVRVLDDSPAEQPVRRPAAAAGARPDLSATAADGAVSSRDLGPPPDPIWPDDSPPAVVVTAARPPPAGPPAPRRLQLYVSPEEEAAPAPREEGAGASPALRRRGGAFVTLVTERRGRRRSEAGAGAGRRRSSAVCGVGSGAGSFGPPGRRGGTEREEQPSPVPGGAGPRPRSALSSSPPDTGPLDVAMITPLEDTPPPRDRGGQSAHAAAGAAAETATVEAPGGGRTGRGVGAPGRREAGGDSAAAPAPVQGQAGDSAGGGYAGRCGAVPDGDCAALCADYVTARGDSGESRGEHVAERTKQTPTEECRTLNGVVTKRGGASRRSCAPQPEQVPAKRSRRSSCQPLSALQVAASSEVTTTSGITDSALCIASNRNVLQSGGEPATRSESSPERIRLSPDSGPATSTEPAPLEAASVPAARDDPGAAAAPAAGLSAAGTQAARLRRSRRLSGRRVSGLFGPVSVAEPGAAAGRRSALSGRAAGLRDPGERESGRSVAEVDAAQGDVGLLTPAAFGGVSLSGNRRSSIGSEENSPVIGAARTKPCSVSVSRGSSPVTASVTTRRRSVIASEGSSPPAATKKTKRRSAIGSEGSIPATATTKARRRSVIASKSSSPMTATTKTGGRSVIGSEGSSPAAATTKAKRRSAFSSQGSSPAGAGVNTRRRSMITSEGSSRAAATTRTRRRSVIFSESSSPAVATTKARRRSAIAVPSEVSCPATGKAKARRRSAVGSESSTSAVATTKARRRSVIAREGSSPSVTTSKTTPRSAMASYDSSTNAASANTRLLPSADNDDSSLSTTTMKTRRRSSVGGEYIAAATLKTTRCPATVGEDSIPVATVRTRRLSLVSSESDSPAEASVKSQRLSFVGGVDRSPVTTKIKRHSGVGSEVVITVSNNATALKRRSVVGSDASEPTSEVDIERSDTCSTATAAAKTRRRSGVGGEGSSDVTAAKARRRSGVGSEGSSDVTAAKAGHRSGVGGEGSSDVTAAKARRRSGVGGEGSSDVTAAKTRRRSGVGGEGSSDVTAAKTRRRSGVGSEGSSDVTAAKARRRSGVGSEGSSDVTATLAAGHSGVTSEPQAISRPDDASLRPTASGELSSAVDRRRSWTGRALPPEELSTDSGGGDGSQVIARRQLWPGPSTAGNAAAGNSDRPVAAARRQRRRSLDPVSLAADLAAHGFSGEPGAAAARLQRARQRRRQRAGATLPTVLEESPGQMSPPPLETAQR